MSNMESTRGYSVISLDHNHFSLEQLGLFVPIDINVENWSFRLKNLKTHFSLNEIFFLNTCNRLCLFTHSTAPINHESAIEIIEYWLNRPISKDDSNKLKLYNGAHAIGHIFGLSSSVESLVVGEREILHQIKSAYSTSKKWELCGDHIRLAIKSAVMAAKEVYAKTQIGDKPVSVVSIALRKLSEYSIPDKPRYILIGAGQTINLAAKFLHQRKFESVDVFNRTLSKAEVIAKSLKGQAHNLNDLSTFTDGFDVMIVCTGLKKALITEDLYSKLSPNGGKKIIIDLSVPHNVDPSVQLLPEVRYISIEQLRALAKKNLNFRKNEVEKANEIISQHITAFEQTHLQRQIERAFSNISSEIKDVKKRALNQVFNKKIELLDSKSKELIYEMMDYMEKKCIAVPIKAAKSTIAP